MASAPAKSCGSRRRLRLPSPANNNDFSLIHINIPSLNNNFEKLEELLLDLGKILKLIAISETKLQTKFNSYILRYNFIQNDSKTNSSGVGLFIKDTLNFAIVKISIWTAMYVKR